MSRNGSKSRFSISKPTKGNAHEYYDGVDPEMLLKAIQACAKQGVGITFGATRDGGAVCVALLDGKEVEKAYASDAGELCDLLEVISIQAQSLE